MYFLYYIYILEYNDLLSLWILYRLSNILYEQYNVYTVGDIDDNV